MVVLKGIVGLILACLFLCAFGQQGSEFAQCLDQGGVRITSLVCVPALYVKSRPPEGKTMLGTDIRLEYVQSVNEADLTISSLVFVRLSWLEPRLILNESGVENDTNTYETSEPANLEYLWKPSLYMDTLIKIDGIQRLCKGFQYYHYCCHL